MNVVLCKEALERSPDFTGRAGNDTEILYMIAMKKLPDQRGFPYRRCIQVARCTCPDIAYVHVDTAEAYSTVQVEYIIVDVERYRTV